MTGGCDISSDIALRWTSLDLCDAKSTLVQVMTWCRQATCHYLNQCWPRSLPPYGVTRPQCVNTHQLMFVFRGIVCKIQTNIIRRAKMPFFITLAVQPMWVFFVCLFCLLGFLKFFFFFFFFGGGGCVWEGGGGFRFFCCFFCCCFSFFIVFIKHHM